MQQKSIYKKTGKIEEKSGRNMEANWDLTHAHADTRNISTKFVFIAHEIGHKDTLCAIKSPPALRSSE